MRIVIVFVGQHRIESEFGIEIEFIEESDSEYLFSYRKLHERGLLENVHD
jgi:hypothetical protein